MVIAAPSGHHRLLVREQSAGATSGYFVAADAHLEMRLAAIARFHEPSGRSSCVVGRQVLRPTAYQKHRLVLFLKILDRLADPEKPHPALRNIAADVVYPKSQFGRAIEWKSSSERRRTQRLVKEAKHLMRTGYRDLLKGRAGGSGCMDDRGSS